MFSKKQNRSQNKIKTDSNLVRAMGYLKPYIVKDLNRKPEEMVQETIRESGFLHADIRWGVITKRAALKCFNRFIKVAYYDPEMVHQVEHGPGYLAYYIQKTEEKMKKPEFEPLP